MQKKRVTIRSLPENLEFELDIKFVQKDAIVAEVTKGREVRVDTQLPSKMVTKLCVLIRTTNFTQVALRPIEETGNPLEALQTNQRNFVEIICQNSDHLRQVIELNEALEVKDMAPFVGFMSAYHLRGKTEDEYGEFFGVAAKATEERRKAFAELCGQIPEG